MNRLLLTLALSLSVLFSHAVVVTAVGNGNWNVAGTWDVGVPAPGDDVVINGFTVTVTTNQTCNTVTMNSNAGNDSQLDVTGGTLTVTSNFSIIQNSGGRDIEFHVDNAAIVNVGGNFLIDQDNGDDVEVYINSNSGTTAQLNVTGTFTINKDGGDDIRINVDDVNSRIQSTGNFTVNHNQGAGDLITFNLDEGDLTTAATFTVNTASDAGDVDFDMDGGDLTCVDMTLNLAGGDDIHFYIDENSVVTATGNLTNNMTGGDDIDYFINDNAGTTAQLNVTGNFVVSKPGTNADEFEMELNEANSLVTVGGDYTVTWMDGNGDVVFIDLNDGDLNITGDMNLTRAADAAQIEVNMDGGDIDVNDITVASGGTLFSPGAVLFTVDQNSRIDATGNFTATMTGGDDLYLRINVNAGTSGVVDIDGNLTITRSNGDDIHVHVVRDDSRLNVGGNVAITTTGGERMEFYVHQDARVDIDGNFTYTHTEGQDGEVQIGNGGGQTPNVDVAGNFSFIANGGNDDLLIDINRGAMSVGGNMALTQSGASDDIDLTLTNAAQLSVTGNVTATLSGGDDVRMDMNNTSQFNVTGSVTLDHNSATGGDDLFLRFDGTSTGTIGNDLTLDSDAPATTTDLLYVDVNTGTRLTVGDDIFFIAAAADNAEVELNGTGYLLIAGDFVRQAVPNMFGLLDCNGTSTVEYNGTTAQVFAQDAGSGGDFFDYENVVINNTLATTPQLTMEGLATVHGGITFTDGIVSSTNANILVIDHGATTAGASNASYVDGYVRKVGRNPGGEFNGGAGTDSYAFPVGGTDTWGVDNYAPIYMTRPGNAADEFDASYVWTYTPHDVGYDSTMKDASIHHPSDNEYWILDRNAGTSNVSVTLSWNSPRSGGVTALPDLLVVRWDGTQWRNHGNGATSGNTTAGTVQTLAAVTTFSPFTLASSSSQNPLPVDILTFNGENDGDHNRLEWITLTEVNNDHFTLERSKDAKVFSEIAQIKGAGNSWNPLTYHRKDYDISPGVYYYRLKQTDRNGKFSYSDIVAVKVSDSNEPGLLVFPNPTGNGVVNVMVSNLQADAEISVRNMLGQVVQSTSLSQNSRALTTFKALAQGTYIVEVRSNGSLITEKLIVQ